LHIENLYPQICGHLRRFPPLCPFPGPHFLHRLDFIVLANSLTTSLPRSTSPPSRSASHDPSFFSLPFSPSPLVFCEWSLPQLLIGFGGPPSFIPRSWPLHLAGLSVLLAKNRVQAACIAPPVLRGCEVPPPFFPIFCQAALFLRGHLLFCLMDAQFNSNYPLPSGRPFVRFDPFLSSSHQRRTCSLCFETLSEKHPPLNFCTSASLQAYSRFPCSPLLLDPPCSGTKSPILVFSFAMNRVFSRRGGYRLISLWYPFFCCFGATGSAPTHFRRFPPYISVFRKLCWPSLSFLLKRAVFACFFFLLELGRWKFSF